MNTLIVEDSICSPSSILSRWEDSQLLNALANDNRLAFAELYERYWDRLYRIAYQKTRSHETAEELVQDLFVQLWQKRKSLHVNRIDHYLLNALKYSVIDHIKHQLVRQRFQKAHLATAPIADSATETYISYKDLVSRIEIEMVKLPTRTQEIFRLSRFDGLTIPEISSRLDLSTKVVEYHLSKALKALRLQLQHYICLLIMYITIF